MRNMILFAIFIIGLTLPMTSTFAQDSTMTQPATLAEGWAAVTGLMTGEKVKVVATAGFKRQHSCTISSVSATEIGCLRNGGRKPVIYTTKDVAAIFNSGSGTSADHRDFAFCEAIAGGIIAGAVFLGRTGSAIGIFGGAIIGVAGLVVGASCGLLVGDEETPIPPKLIYRKSGLHHLGGVPD